MDLDVTFPTLKFKPEMEGEGEVVLTVSSNSVVCQLASIEVPTPVDLRRNALRASTGSEETAGKQPSTPCSKPKKDKNVKGGTWSTRHLLR